MEEFLIEVRKLAYSESEKTGMPIKHHIDLATKTGIRLSKTLNANTQIVESGTLLMDCMIGQALKENRLADHVEMSLKKAYELFEFSSLSQEEKDNISHCILEHHGVEKFYSIESEICCNADCYRFASIKGFMFATRYLREMPFSDLVNRLKEKVNEKQKAITLNIVKEELESEYTVINGLLKKLI